MRSIRRSGRKTGLRNAWTLSRIKEKPAFLLAFLVIIIINYLKEAFIPFCDCIVAKQYAAFGERMWRFYEVYRIDVQTAV